MRWRHAAEIRQLEDQIIANEKQIREDTEARESGANEAEAQRLLAHAEVACNEQPASGAKRSVEPASEVSDAGSEEGWTKPERRSRQAAQGVDSGLAQRSAGFRPGTKMPTFWRFGTCRRNGHMRDEEQEQIQAISAYLWQESFDSKLATAAGNAATARNFSKLAAVSPATRSAKATASRVVTLPLTCNASAKSKLRLHRALDSQSARTLGALLSQRKRDLTPKITRRRTCRSVFDTELHSRCPNDGAELQVQNMTVMPNFRLSEQTRATSPPISSRSLRRRVIASADFMDDPNLKGKGATDQAVRLRRLSRDQGFEEEQRIGKELTVEGATPIERLDFALLTHHAEEGRRSTESATGAERRKPWYNHKGFFEHKITEPSIYDEGKEKDPKDRLRMPKPYLTPEWRER